jgi:hypothetical protein
MNGKVTRDAEGGQPKWGGRTECDGALRSLENTLPSPCTEPFPIEGLSISGCEKYGGQSCQ